MIGLTGVLPFDPSTTKKDDLEAIGFGLSSIVLHVKDTNSVVKTFPPLDKDQDGERRIYEHLQRDNGHPNILKYFGKCPAEYELLRSGLAFEYHPRGTLLASFDKLDEIGVSEKDRQRFAVPTRNLQAEIPSYSDMLY